MNRIEAVEAIVESFKRRGYVLSDSGEWQDIELRRSVGSDDTIVEFNPGPISGYLKLKHPDEEPIEVSYLLEGDRIEVVGPSLVSGAHLNCTPPPVVVRG